MAKEKASGHAHERNAPGQPPSGRLAIAFQEPLAAIIKLQKAKANFRERIQKQLKQSEKLALRDGYSGEDVTLARFAIVAFLDEAVLHSNNDALSGWQQFLGDDAGEVFFNNLETIRNRGNTSETADLLEIYAYCLLLGFGGKYRVDFPAEKQRESAIRPEIDSTTQKIRRIRAGSAIPQPWARRPADTTEVASDRWLRIWFWTAAATFVLVCLIFLGFQHSLRSVVAEVHAVLGTRAQ